MLGNETHVVQFSGNWNNGDQVSTFYLNLNNDSANRNQNIGTQIMYIKRSTQHTLPLGKTQRANVGLVAEMRRFNNLYIMGVAS